MDTITATQLADLMDDCTGDDGQWNGGDVCEALADLISRRGGWKECAEHGHYSAAKSTCPLGDGCADR